MIFSVFSLGLLLLMSGCKKYDTEEKAHCRIAKVYTNYPDVATFYYTAWGAPSSIMVSAEGTGNPSYFFQYDKDRRLVGFIAGFAREDDTLYHEYSKYGYENNIIVRDTIFVEGHTQDPHDNGSPYWLGSYKYDKWGRVINYHSEVKYEDDTFVNDEDYDYSNEDPRAPNTSIMGTHKYLMFVSRDYHKTNVAEAYNEYGYPTDFGSKGYFFKLANFRKIEYDCNVRDHWH